jgi:hypothetical protein
MAINSRTHRPSNAARRGGYVVAVVLDAALLCMINIWPRWHAVPFLTADMKLVLPVLNLSLVAGLVANVVFVAYDPPWWKSLYTSVGCTSSPHVGPSSP